MTVKVKKISETATLPTIDNNNIINLYANIPGPHEVILTLDDGVDLIPTGIACNIPDGYLGFLYLDENIASKYGHNYINFVNVIKPHYKDEIKITLSNKSGLNQVVNHGECIAKLIIQEVPQIELEKSYF